MSSNTKQLYFDYPDTSRIRILKSNCFENDNYPCVYRIKTEKLDFLIPKTAVILGKDKYVYIALSEYRQALTNFYKQVRA